MEDIPPFTADQLTAFELIPRAALDLALIHIPGRVDPLTAHSWYVLLEMSSSQTDSGIRGLLERLLEGALTDDLIADGVIAESGAQAKDLWHIREAIVEAQDNRGRSSTTSRCRSAASRSLSSAPPRR